MFKFVILFLVAVYVLELLFLRRRRRLVRDVNTLVRYMLLAAFLFTGFTEIPHIKIVEGSILLQALALLLWAMLSYWLSQLFAAFFLREGK